MDVTSPTEVRPVEPDDLEAVLALWVSAAPPDERRDAEAQARTGAHLRASLRHPRCVVLAAVAEGRLLGVLTAHVDVHPTLDGALGVLDEVRVHPAARRRGVGTSLVAEAAVRLGRKGVRGLRGELPPGEAAARAFASSVGFAPGAQLVSRAV